MATYSIEQDYSKNSEGLYECLLDGKKFITFGSLENYLKNKYNISYITYIVQNNLDSKENYLECKECGQYCKNLKAHIRNYHKDIDSNIYDSKHKPDKWVCDSTSKKISDLTTGEKNAMHSSKRSEQQRKENSPFSIEFWKKKNPNMSDEEASIKVKETAKKACDDRLTPTQLEYWIEKFDGDIEKAKKHHSERQTTFNMEICIEKYGEEEGMRIWKERQDKWKEKFFNNSQHVGGYSLVSQELFDDLMGLYNHYNIDSDKVYYATKNKEYFIKTTEKFFLFDFIDLNKNKIIEFNGDIYHANPNLFKSDDKPNPFLTEKTSSEIWKHDELKLQTAKSKGFDVLVIWENDYKKNKEEVLKRCLEFLNIK